MGDIDLLAIATEPVAGHGALPRLPPGGQDPDGRRHPRAPSSSARASRSTCGSCPPECYGAALVYFTGSKEHNVKLRRRAVERGLRISEYGVFRVEDAGRRRASGIAGREEADVYAAVGLAWIPPRCGGPRRDRGRGAAGRSPG